MFREKKDIAEAAAKYAAGLRAKNGNPKPRPTSDNNYLRCPSGEHFAYAGGNFCGCDYR